MNRSEDISALVKALSAAQGELGAVGKNREVSVRSKSGAEYKFKYATLDAIIEHVRPALIKHGLWFAQGCSSHTAAGRDLLVTTLFHESGQWIESYSTVPHSETNQEFGSALTYQKRYALSAILGVAAEDDDDANQADGNEIRDVKDKTPKSGKQVTVETAHDAAGEKAKAFALESLATLKSFPDVAAFDAWYTKQTRDMIGRVKKYDASLHRDLVIAVGAFLDAHNPADADSDAKRTD